MWWPARRFDRGALSNGLNGFGWPKLAGQRNRQFLTPKVRLKEGLGVWWKTEETYASH